MNEDNTIQQQPVYLNSHSVTQHYAIKKINEKIMMLRSIAMKSFESNAAEGTT